MIRARFEANEGDYRPINWPVKHPYWCTGYGQRTTRPRLCAIGQRLGISTPWRRQSTCSLTGSPDRIGYPLPPRHHRRPQIANRDYRSSESCAALLTNYSHANSITPWSQRT